MTPTLRLLLLLAPLTLSACESRLTVKVTDAPVDDAEAVVLRVSGVDLLRDDGALVTLDTEARDIDFLQYQDGQTYTLIDEAEVASGRYVGARLRVADSGSYLLRKDGGKLPIVNSAEAGEFGSLAFELDEDEEATILLDLELRFSLDEDSAAGNLALTPVLRVLREGEHGSLEGTVAADLVEADSCRQGRTLGRGVSVYAYAGHGITPDDYARTAVTALPLSAAAVRRDESDDVYRYRFAFLPEGDYSLALTCGADAERPAVQDDIVFVRRRHATVTQGGSARLDFAAE